MTFHASNLGRFGERLPVDLDGYCHTTLKAWMKAPVDWGGDRPTREQRLDFARDMAADVRAAVKSAESAIADWRASNRSPSETFTPA